MPKKAAIKTKKRKTIRHHLRRTKKIVLHKYVLISLGVLSVIVVFLVIININQSNKILQNIKDDASSLLAYNRDQIIKAGIVGTRQKLQSEIIGYSDASESLKDYSLKDYKNLKKSCVVNNKLAEHPTYTIAAVVDDKYALIQKGCGSPINTILMKSDNKWSVIFEGNTDIACNISNDFAIPQPVSRYCVFEGHRYLNPNP